MLCKVCSGFRIDSLLERYAAQRSRGGSMAANETYYRHQPHYFDLFGAAKAGCTLCKYIYGELAHQVSLEFSPAYAYRYNMQYGEDQVYFGHPEIEPLKDPLSIVVSQKNTFGSFRTIARLELVVKGGSYAILTSIHKTKTGIESSMSDSEIIKTREIPENPASPACLALARAFLQTCMTSHPECAAPKLDNILPERVIDVGPADGSEDPYLLISDGKIGAWIALTYSWGGRSESVLSTATYQEFQHGISLDRIPKTIRDAIIITRALNFRYLWIDALCIVQDSPDDWARATVGMSRIYKDSTLTIAAACSTSSEDGFLKPRVGCPHWPVTSGLETANKSKQLFLRPFTFYEKDPFSESQLPTRGWILQESILSPRILSYTHNEIVWHCSKQLRECGRIFDDSNTNSGMPQIASLLRSHLRGKGPVAVPWYKHLQVKRAKTNREMSDTFYMGWLEIISDYTGRKLTVPSDVLPALSGLAKEYPRASDDEYCAGIWKSQLLPGLYWSREDPHGGGVASDKQSEKNELEGIPSWSWASIQGPKANFSKGRDMILPGSIMDVQVIPRLEGDPFYDTKEGFIHINAPFVEISDFKKPDRRASGDNTSGESDPYPCLNGWVRNEWRTNPAFRSEYRQKHVEFDNQVFGVLMIGEKPEWSKVAKASSSAYITEDEVESLDDGPGLLDRWDRSFNPPGPFLFLILESVDSSLMDGFKKFKRVGLIHVDLESHFRNLQADAKNRLRKPDARQRGPKETVTAFFGRLELNAWKELNEKANAFCAEMYDVRDAREESLVLV